MSSSIRVSEKLFKIAYRRGKKERRSAAKQIEFWAEIGRTVEKQTGVTMMDLMKVSSGAKTIKIEESGIAIQSSTILDHIEMDKSSGDFQKEILKRGPVYQRCLSNPRCLEQIHPDGSVKIGNFINGHFVEVD